MATPHRNPASEDADYYTTLGIPAGSDEEAIRLAYRQLARKYHPDVAGDPGSEMMKRLNAAYHTLSDPDRRREYDQRYGFRGPAVAAPVAERPARPTMTRPTPARPAPTPPLRQTRSEGGPLRLYRLIEGMEGTVNAVAFAQGGDLLGLGTSDGQIALWRLNAHQRVATLRLRADDAARPGVLRELRLSPSGAYVMAWGLFLGTHVWNATTRTTLWQSAVNGPSGLMDGLIYDAPAMVRLAMPAAPLALAEIDPFQWADAGRSGTDLLTRPLDQPGGISPLWAVPLHCEEPRVPGTRGPRIHQRVLSWDGELLLTFATGPASPTISNSSVLRLWNLRPQGRVGGNHPQPVGQVQIPARALWYPIAVSSLAYIVAIHLEDRAMRLYDVRTSKHVDLLTGPLPPETLAAISPDGALLALAPPDGHQVSLWATSSGQRIQTWEVAASVVALSFAPPGHLPTLAIGRVDGTCEVWVAG